MMALAELLILGRLEFMETNMNLFKIYLFTIIFFNSALFADLNTTEKNDFIYQKKEEIPIAKFDVNKKILNDSLVLQWDQETKIEGFKKLGNFLYKLNAIEQSNENIIIPMFGQSDSLNVSITSSIIIYEALKQRKIF